MQRDCALGAAGAFPWFWDAKLSSVRLLLRNDGTFGCLSLDRVFCVACGGLRVPLRNGLLYAIWCGLVWPAAAADGAEHVDGWRKTVTWCEPRLGAVGLARSVVDLCGGCLRRKDLDRHNFRSVAPPRYMNCFAMFLLLGRDATLFRFLRQGS
jgi:hypothetical protein